MPFEFYRLEIPDIILVKPKVFFDARGFFLESYKFSEFRENGIECRFVQDNHSKSVAGVIRGLHYQNPPMAQAKLVRVIKGEIFDVAVDIRKGSPYFKKWVGVILSEENKYMLYIPEGFAHGFCVLSKEAEVVYKCSHEYDPNLEGGIVWNDPEIGITWPIENPIISSKDQKWPYLNYALNHFIYKGDIK